MEQLPNNCRIGKMSVFPKNWDSKKLDKEIIDQYWYVKYRFYDDNTHKEKQVVLKNGVNEYKTLHEKQDAIRDLIQIELAELKEGYNPISKKKSRPVSENISIVGPNTTFNKALELAQSSLKLEGFTMKDMNAIVEKVKAAAQKVQVDAEPIDTIKIYDIKKRHIRAIMNRLSADNNWSAHAWNKYRTHLMMLFKELGEYDAVESNIPREISKRKTIKKIRVVLSEDERKKIKDHLIQHNRRFWLFVNMFFHSGARISEFFRIKIADVNLDRQTVLVTIKKGRQYIEVVKPIKNISMPYWAEYIKEFDDKDMFLMGEGLFPSKKVVRYDQINKRWRKIKIKLNIEADFYSLKHLNTDQVSEQIGIMQAQRLNSHTSVRTTKIYAINEGVREMELIKKVSNEF